MLENEFHVALLIAGSLKGNLTEQQEKELHEWLQASGENRIRFDRLNNVDELNNKLKLYHSADGEAIWTATKHKMNAIKLDNKNAHTRIIRNPWHLLFAAASVILIIGVALFLFEKKAEQKLGQITQSNIITPGHNTATLTLSNGKKIILSKSVNGTLTEEDGVVISKTTDGQLIYEIKENKDGNADKTNTLSTARGETYQVILPDGSKVWLNAASILKYPASFASFATRRVELDGEAYFEVSKDKQHPFVVSSRGQEVLVLGTHFNINSYSNEPVMRTMLLEGSVKISTLDAYKSISKLLVPGQQAKVSGNIINVAPGDVEEAVAWKNGEFLFKNGDFKTAMRQIERWYDIEVIIDASVPKDFELGGFISRSKDLLSVLNLIELTKDVHFKVEGRRVLVTK